MLNQSLSFLSSRDGRSGSFSRAFARISKGKRGTQPRCLDFVAALSTAILAVLVAIAALLSAEHANEAMMNQIEASNQWNYFQAKNIKAAVLDAKITLAGGASESDQSKRSRYEKEQEEIKSEAERRQTDAKSHFHKHQVFARAVTMFQNLDCHRGNFRAHKAAPILDCEFSVRRNRLRLSRPRRDGEVRRERTFPTCRWGILLRAFD
jgi:hypothetical protein